MKLTHCLTFDIEEHFQVSAFDSPMRRRAWANFESRVERNTDKILELLAMRDVRATFFVLGWVAERHPQLVQRIVERGHEVASHGYAHEMLSCMTPARFREDVRKAKDILEGAIGERVLGYRAPSFTIMEDTRWALRILVEEGHVYDSSIFPILHDRYGLPGALPGVHRLMTEVGPLWEVPPATVKIAGVRVPVAGGGYFRLYPYQVFRRMLQKGAIQSSPLVFYLHAWELDPGQPRMSGSWRSRFRHYINLDKTEEHEWPEDEAREQG